MKKTLFLFILIIFCTAKAFADTIPSYYNYKPSYSNAPVMYMNGIDAMKLNQDYQNSLKKNTNQYNQTNPNTENAQNDEPSSAKMLKKKNKELEKKVNDLERKVKELDYRLYNLEKIHYAKSKKR